MKQTIVERATDNELLHKELKEAGFSVDGVTVDGDRTVVILHDSETKDPSAIIAAHTGTAPYLWKFKKRDLYANATTADEKIKLIAALMDLLPHVEQHQVLGLPPPEVEEHQ